MRQSLGFAWFAGASLWAAALAAASVAFLLDAGPMAGLAAAALALLAGLLSLVATPLALAPAEMLRASLVGGAARVWGTERQDTWGALARDIAGTDKPPPPAPDPAIDVRRLSANLELTLRQTAEELAVVRERMGQAASTLESAAFAGERLSGIAAEASRQLADAVQRTDDATGALAVLPAIAMEQAAAVERAAARSLAAADAMTEAAARKPEPAARGSDDEGALREVVQLGAEQARRLEHAMQLLGAAIAQLPAAAASQQRLSGIAEALAVDTGRLAAEVERLSTVVPPQPEPSAGPAVPAEATAAGIEAALARCLVAISEMLAAERAQNQQHSAVAADRVAERVGDIAEVMALQAAWSATDAASGALQRFEAAAAAKLEAMAGAGEALAATVTGAAGLIAGTVESRLSAALEAQREAAGDGREMIASVADRLEAVAATIGEAMADTTVREVACAMADRAEGLLVRLEELGAALGSAPGLASPEDVADRIVVSGQAPLDAVVYRVAGVLDEGPSPGPSARLQSLDETIRVLQSFAGEMAARDRAG